jgi:enediyne biosynthesis protein E4
VIRHPFPAPLAQRPVLFRNSGMGKFREVSKSEGTYFQSGHRGRGVAIGDLNNDGFPDVIVSHVQEPVAILRNISPRENHWVGVQLVGQDKRTAVGAKLTVEANKRTLTRFAKGGASYLSANDGRLILGLGSATQAGKLIVHWNSGTPRVESWQGLEIDKYHRLQQGKGQSVE